MGSMTLEMFEVFRFLINIFVSVTYRLHIIDLSKDIGICYYYAIKTV